MTYHRACCCDKTTMYVASEAFRGASAWKFTHSGNLLASYADITEGKAWIAVTPGGNVAICGDASSGGPGSGGNRYNLWMLDADLQFQWGVNLGYIQYIEIDADGSIYTGGAPVSRLDATGNLVWSNATIGLSAGIDIDADHVYATGWAYDFTPNVAKLRKSDGSIVWSASDHVVDPVGWYHGVRAGAGGSLIHTESEYVVKRNAATGAIEATYEVDTFHVGSLASSLDIDASGNIYVGGTTNSYWTGTDGTDRNIWKLDSDLNLLDSAYGQGIHVWSIQVDDSDGSIWTASQQAPANLGSVRKWSSDLIQLGQGFMASFDAAIATYGYRNIST